MVNTQFLVPHTFISSNYTQQCPKMLPWSLEVPKARTLQLHRGERHLPGKHRKKKKTIITLKRMGFRTGGNPVPKDLAFIEFFFSEISENGIDLKDV